MQGSKFGYVVYGSGLFTSEKMIAVHSDGVQGVIEQSTDAAKTFTDKYQSAAKAAKL